MSLILSVKVIIELESVSNSKDHAGYFFLTVYAYARLRSFYDIRIRDIYVKRKTHLQLTQNVDGKLRKRVRRTR